MITTHKQINHGVDELYKYNNILDRPIRYKILGIIDTNDLLHVCSSGNSLEWLDVKLGT